MVLTAWLLLSCKASDLHISLPPRGREGISQEDIQRDLYLAQTEKNEAWLVDRMQQMGLNLYRDPKGSCFGTKNKRRIVALKGVSLEASIAKAVLISLAKAMHKTEHIVDVCIYTKEPQKGEWWLQDLSGGRFVFEKTRIYTRTTSQRVSSMDFRVLRDEVKNLARLLGIP